MVGKEKGGRGEGKNVWRRGEVCDRKRMGYPVCAGCFGSIVWDIEFDGMGMCDWNGKVDIGKDVVGVCCDNCTSAV